MRTAAIMAACVCAGLIAACAVASQQPAPSGEIVLEFTSEVLGEIELLIIDSDGKAIEQVAVFVEGDVWAVPFGGVVLSVTGPVTVMAYKPGYGPSRPQIMLPGQRLITLYPLVNAH
jgi:hypothetical protein